MLNNDICLFLSFDHLSEPLVVLFKHCKFSCGHFVLVSETYISLKLLMLSVSDLSDTGLELLNSRRLRILKQLQFMWQSLLAGSSHCLSEGLDSVPCLFIEFFNSLLKLMMICFYLKLLFTTRSLQWFALLNIFLNYSNCTIIIRFS